MYKLVVAPRRDLRHVQDGCSMLPLCMYTDPQSDHCVLAVVDGMEDPMADQSHFTSFNCPLV